MAKLLISECRKFMQIVSERAAELGVDVAVAVVGPEGHLIALERMDKAGFITPDAARAKAFTVAAFRSMSPRFADGRVIQKWFKERNPQMLVNASVFTNGQVFASGGSAPVFIGDELVGAYGISGSTGDTDEELGSYARDALGWRHAPENDTTPEHVKQHVNDIYTQVGLSDRAL